MTGAAPRALSLRERRLSRPCWADLADSSQECSKDETLLAPLVDDSYDTPASGVNSKDGLDSRFSKALIKSGPIDFSFLTDPTGSDTTGTSASSNASKTLNASAPSFMPMTSRSLVAQPSSPNMPPPAIPQAAIKSRRIRGKRALSSIQEPKAVKRPKEGDQEPPSAPAGQPQQRVIPFVEPPPATEEEWLHRISKRVKVVNSIKETPEYRGYFDMRPVADRLDEEPRTPTAEDRNLSKRRWEYEVQQWRNQLKQWAVDNAGGMQLDGAELPAFEEAEDELSPDL